MEPKIKSGPVQKASIPNQSVDRGGPLSQIFGNTKDLEENHVWGWLAKTSC